MNLLIWLAGQKFRVRLFIICSALFCFGTSISCSQNVLSDMAKKDTDKALLFEAKIQINKQNWTSAIESFSKMSVSYRSTRGVAFIEASAYAGRCGLDLLTFIENIGNEISSKKLYLILMENFPGASAVNIADCKQAETLIKSIESLPANRSVDENILMAFVGFAKIGIILNTYADTDNNGTPDGTFNACADGSFPEADVRHVGTGLAEALASLQAAATAGSSIGGTELSNLNSGCSDLATQNAAYNFCSETDPAALTADQIKGIRTITQEPEFLGIGSCTPDLVSCLCP